MTTDAERDESEQVGPSGRRDTPEREDAPGPLEEPTQPMGKVAGAGTTEEAAAERARPEELDTTTWGGGVAPPVLHEDAPSPSPGSSGPAPPLDRAPDGEVPPVLEEQETVVSAAPFEEEPTRPPDDAAVEPSLHPLLLERIEPPLGRGERIRLDASVARIEVGRAEENDLRLYTASASRHHAVIERDAGGRWTITPLGMRTIRIDGDETREPVPLELGMNVVLGQDHLRCVSEGLEAGARSARTEADGLGGSPAGPIGGEGPIARIPRIGWIAGAIAVLLVVGLLIVVL